MFWRCTASGCMWHPCHGRPGLLNGPVRPSWAPGRSLGAAGGAEKATGDRWLALAWSLEAVPRELFQSSLSSFWARERRGTKFWRAPEPAEHQRGTRNAGTAPTVHLGRRSRGRCPRAPRHQEAPGGTCERRGQGDKKIYPPRSSVACRLASLSRLRAELVREKGNAFFSTAGSSARGSASPRGPAKRRNLFRWRRDHPLRGRGGTPAAFPPGRRPA